MIRVLVIVVANVVGASSGLDWTNDYSEALSNARCEGRPMLVVLENREKAKQRAGSIFHVEPKLLTQFEICRVDVGSDYGKKVADRFSPSELPYTVITDPECEQIVFRGVGERTIGQWTETLEVHTDEDEGAIDSGTDIDPESNSSAKPINTKPARPASPFKKQDLDTAKIAATESGRRLVVFVSMDNCVFCDKMQATTFSDGSVVGALGGSEFETVIIKNEMYPDFVNAHDIKIFPSTLVFSSEGNLLTKIDGYVDAADFMTRLNATR